ncbi:MAG TPA: DUF6691 family protein [Chryseolinea sp.]|nr:DUF6691 family protein [Chryseolinea sp.]
MRKLLYLIIGVAFGLALTKGEAVSWYRMQEMFHFQSFHMYGIFMTAIPVGAISIWLIKAFNVRTLDGEAVIIPEKKFHKGIVIGGLIFGFGWALTGACPGPLYALIGGGYTVTLVTFISALAGTWVFARFERHLPR